MKHFERVHTIGELYDGVRTGTADYCGAPHYFVSQYEDVNHGSSDRFQLYPVTSTFMEYELRHWSIFREWEGKFHRGLAVLAEHPGHGRISHEYDELSEWIDQAIKTLTPMKDFFTAEFRVLPYQEEIPMGILRELEVAWTISSPNLNC